MRIQNTRMKKLLLAAFFIALFSAANAQTGDTLDYVVNQFCECVTKKQDSLPTENKKIDLMDELQGCILSVIADNIDVFKAQYGKSFVLNESNGEKIGREIGMRAVMNCPAFLKMVSQSQQFQDEIEKREDGEEKSEYTKTATLKSVIEDKDFIVVIKDGNGREERLQVIRNGAGIPDFVANYKKYVGKLITVTYAIVEVYSAERKDFELKKEIQSVEIE